MRNSNTSVPDFSMGVLRTGICARWFIDGHDTYLAMAQAMLNAKSSIFITGWFISPFIPLVRGSDLDNNGGMPVQLHTILRQKANEVRPHLYSVPRSLRLPSHVRMVFGASWHAGYSNLHHPLERNAIGHGSR
jgi:hypothetical protein